MIFKVVERQRRKQKSGMDCLDIKGSVQAGRHNVAVILCQQASGMYKNISQLFRFFVQQNRVSLTVLFCHLFFVSVSFFKLDSSSRFSISNVLRVSLVISLTDRKIWLSIYECSRRLMVSWVDLLADGCCCV